MAFFGNSFGGVSMLTPSRSRDEQGVMSASPGTAAGARRANRRGRSEPRPDVAEASRKISKEPVWEGIWRDPYAISEDCFLVAAKRASS